MDTEYDEMSRFDEERQILLNLWEKYDAVTIFAMRRSLGLQRMKELQFNDDDLLADFFMIHTLGGRQYEVLNVLLDSGWQVTRFAVENAVMFQPEKVVRLLWMRYKQSTNPDHDMGILHAVTTSGRGSRDLDYIRFDFIRTLGPCLLLKQMKDDIENDWSYEDIAAMEVQCVIEGGFTALQTVDDTLLESLQVFIEQCTDSSFDLWKRKDLLAIKEHIKETGTATTRDVSRWFVAQMRHKLVCKNNHKDEIDYITHTRLASLPAIFIHISDNICYEIEPFYLWVKENGTNPATSRVLTSDALVQLQTQMSFLVELASLIVRGERNKTVSRRPA